jgi:hypothetical protein
MSVAKNFMVADSFSGNKLTEQQFGLFETPDAIKTASAARRSFWPCNRK